MPQSQPAAASHSDRAPEAPALVWLREDLRLDDNPALATALASGRPFALLYVLDEASEGIRPLGRAARWWLGRSLQAVQAAIVEAGGRLTLRRGAAADIVPEAARELGAGAIYWNRRYGAGEIAVDTALKASLTAGGLAVESFNASLLHEPWTLRTQAGGPFRVFTPFYRHALTRPVRQLVPVAEPWRFAPPLAGDELGDWRLEPHAPDWAGGLRAQWTPGEAGARQQLASFLREGLNGYADGRDRPDLLHVSQLSPHLRFGEISPHQILAAVRHAEAAGAATPRDVDKFVSELYWREFSYHLLFHQPDLASVNFNRRFDAFAWNDDPAAARAWRKGLTGYPLVDAGMRQLWQTGWMHNRVRMVAASFLIKHLLTDWRHGEAWFWDTLVDADPASNPASWQWVAGSGADAAPYFRIFNPVAQGEKFDPDGAYVRRFVPELAALPASVIHKPWTAAPDVLRRAGVRLGDTYPAPLVDHAAARQRALDRHARMDGD